MKKHTHIDIYLLFQIIQCGHPHFKQLFLDVCESVNMRGQGYFVNISHCINNGLPESTNCVFINFPLNNAPDKIVQCVAVRGARGPQIW